MKPRVLVLGKSGGEYHDFDELGPTYERFLTEAGFAVRTSNESAELCSPLLNEVDALVLCRHGDDLDPDEHSALQAAVAGSPWGSRGRPLGLVAVHGAAVCDLAPDEYARLLGARFLVHPEMGPEIQCKITKNHPLSAGLSDFAIVDELYLMDYRLPFRTLLSTEHDGFELPLAWTKLWGRGRVFYTALGHGPEQIESRPFQELILRGLGWTATAAV